MRSKFLSVDFDLAKLDNTLSSLQGLTTSTMRELASKATAAVGSKAREDAIQSTFEYLNLSRTEIAARIHSPETDSAGVTRVKAPVRGMTMQNYGVIQQSRDVRWSNDRIQAMGKTFGPWPGWTERKGDAWGGRNIAANRKSDGVAVRLYRGKPAVRLRHAFTAPLRAGRVDGGNGQGVFDGSKGRFTHQYGPSPYQTFRYFINTKHTEITDDLQKEYVGLLDAKIKGLFK